MVTGGCRSVLFLLLAGSGLAQTLDTAILGVITDPSGASVPSAEITITQPATGFTQRITANHEGAYELRYLRPGEYTVDVAASGFAPERRTNVSVQTGQAARLNFTLQVGQVSQRADVVAEVPLMQTENAALGEVVSTERVTNLPLNGRRFVDLAALTPGVTVRTESQFSLLRANGTRDTTMALSFDGVKATSNRWAFVAMFPASRLHPGIQSTDRKLHRRVRRQCGRKRECAATFRHQCAARQLV